MVKIWYYFNEFIYNVLWIPLAWILVYAIKPRKDKDDIIRCLACKHEGKSELRHDEDCRWLSLKNVLGNEDYRNNVNYKRYYEATLENQSIMWGSIVPVSEKQCHQLHVEIHREARKKLLEHGDFKLLAICDEHIRRHEKFIPKDELTI